MSLLRRRAFTLIELLIVITIIGILAVALLPSVLGAPGRARDAQRKADLKNIAAAIESYYSDNKKYPSGNCVASDGLIDFAKFASYFQGGSIPQDPQGTNAKSVLSCGKGTYYYCNGENSKGLYNYYLMSYVENVENAWMATSNLVACGESDPAKSVRKLSVDAIRNGMAPPVGKGGPDSIPLYILVR